MPRSQCEKENVQLVQELAEVDGPFESPINLNFRDLIKLELPSLTWNKPDAVPKKMKVTNTGHTVIISGKWKCERPYLTGGPLDGKYVFSQIHFHWGPDNCKGSEHQVCGESFPLEMHVAHFKTEYMTQESALREKDGMVVLVYLFKLQEEPNNSLKKIISALPSIRQANSSQPLECRSILALCNPFTDDYFMYWGSVVTSTCAHILLWIVCREPFGISREQIEEFRKIMDASQHPIRRNCREPQPLHKRNVFHVNASRHMDEPMLPIKNIMGCFCYSASEGNDNRSEGDGGCSCNPSSGPQEELEGRVNSLKRDRPFEIEQASKAHPSRNENELCPGPRVRFSIPTIPLSCSRQDPSCKEETDTSRGNGVYLQQTVYYQHATVHSVPALPRRFDDPLERSELTVSAEPEDASQNVQEVSQSCCFLSIEEEQSLSSEKRSRERQKERKRKPIDSVTTLANLIETLETLKTQTYKKLKEIESINHELRGMRSSCENLEEMHWLRHAEKIMSRQKRFTIRSSQCCFSELKKLAKECNFDKLLDDKMITGAEERKPFLVNASEATDSALMCSNASGDKLEFLGLEKIDSTPFSLYNSERFSRKAQKLIRSFFEDIKESEETQMNLEKNLLLKKFEKLSKRASDASNASSINIPPGHMYITKNMMNLGQIRNRFFSEILTDEKAVTPAETKMVSAGKKKKNRSFFKMSLSGYDNDKPARPKKGTKRTLFTKSALAWLNNRLNTIHDTSPIIPLRITDIELKSGSISTKKKSKQSIKSIRKVLSDEHVRTELSSYMSESIISEFSDKQSRYSKQSRTQTRSIIRGIERNSETGEKSEVSIMRIVKDLDANNFFMKLGNSANISSTSEIDSERKDTKFIKRRSRKDIWENGSSTISGFRKELSNKHYGKAQDVQCISSVTGNIIEGRISTSSESSIVIRKQSKREIVVVTSRKQSQSETPRSRDVSVDATEDKSVDSPKRKKLKLEWKCKGYEMKPKELHTISYIETQCQKVSYVESECQADGSAFKAFDDEVTPKHSRENITVSGRKSLECCDKLTEVSIRSVRLNDNESQTETEKDSVIENAGLLLRETSEEATITLPVLTESVSSRKLKIAEVVQKDSENEASEVSISPRRSSDTLSEPCKDFSFEIKRTVVLSSPQESFWNPDEVRFTRLETAPVREQLTDMKSDNFAVLSDRFASEDLKKPEAAPKDVAKDEKAHAPAFLPDDPTDKKVKFQLDNTPKELEYRSGFNVDEIDKRGDLSRYISQNELSECNEYDLQTDSNGTTNYNRQKELRSRDTTPSILSSEDEKQQNTSAATVSSILRTSSRQKPFSAESFNSFKNAYDVKHRKKRQCIKKKSKPLLRRNNSMIKKLNKIGGNNLDFTNLTEEEQLKIISANVARFVKQKLVEHKQFFDFEKNEPMTFDVEQWSNPAGEELKDELEVVSEPVADAKAEEIEEKEVKVAEEQPTVSVPVPVPTPKSIPAPKSIPVPVPASSAVAAPVQSPPPPRQLTPPPLPFKEAIKEEPSEERDNVIQAAETPVIEPSEPPEEQSLSMAGETEKDDKNDPGRQTLDFIKLNKIMAGKYKRRVAPETGKKGKKPMKKEVKKEPVKPPTPKPMSANKDGEQPKTAEPPPKTTEIPSLPQPPQPQSLPQKVDAPAKPEIPKPTMVRGLRAPSVDSARRGVSLQRGPKSDIPVPQGRDQSGSPRAGRSNVRSASATPVITRSAKPKTTPVPPLTLQKPIPPKKRLIPTYTLTSYLPAPTEVIEYQQRELDKYLVQNNGITDLFFDKSKSKKYRGKKSKDSLSQKNLDYLIMLQKRINHEISANIENSMNYVKTLLSQDYNGTAIIEKAPVKNSLDMFDANSGIVFIEMNDQYDCSSSSSEFSEESGFYCIYQGRNRRDKRRSLAREIIVKRNESGDSGLVDSRVYDDPQNDTDSSYNCEVSIVVNPKAQEEDKHRSGGVSDVLKKYIYHLGGGEDCVASESVPVEEQTKAKPHLKKRKERILDIPKEMKRKLLDILEDEMKNPAPGQSESNHTIVLEEGNSETSMKRTDDSELETAEMITKINEIVKQYLDEYDRKQNSEEGQTETGRDGGEKLSDDP